MFYPSSAKGLTSAQDFLKKGLFRDFKKRYAHLQKGYSGEFKEGYAPSPKRTISEF
jgi:hypothetical protein